MKQWRKFHNLGVGSLASACLVWTSVQAQSDASSNRGAEQTHASSACWVPDLTSSTIMALNDKKLLCAPRGTLIPCFSEICLNENLTKRRNDAPWIDYWNRINLNLYGGTPEAIQANKGRPLKDIPRESLENLRKAKTFVNEQVRGIPAAKMEVLALYLAFGAADGRILEMVDRFKPTFCRRITLKASFNSTSGYPTAVWIEPMEPGVLRVTGLARTYIFTTTDEESREKTRKAVVDAHPLVFDRLYPGVGARYLIDGLRIVAKDISPADLLKSQLPTVSYEIDREFERETVERGFENSAQPGCSVKPQSLE